MVTATAQRIKGDKREIKDLAKFCKTGLILSANR